MFLCIYHWLFVLISLSIISIERRVQQFTTKKHSFEPVLINSVNQYVYYRLTKNAQLISLSSYQLVHWSLSPSLLEDHPLILSLPGPPVHPCPSLSIYSCLFSISCKSLLVFLAYLGFLSVYLSVPLNFFQFLHQLHFLIFLSVLNCSLFAG